MWPYWLLFLIPALGALNAARPGTVAAHGAMNVRWSAGWGVLLCLLTLMIGYRFQVGGDWGNYLRNFFSVRGAELDEVLGMGDPGYHLLNWLSVEFGWGIFGVNVVSGLLFSAGLLHFCRSLQRPWLALAAVPYLVIVVAMGYSRQGVALGLAMLGLVALRRGAVAGFVVWVVLGATFHKSAVLLLPIAALAATRNKLWTMFWVGLITLLAYLLLLADAVDALIANYLDAEYQSQGALVRLAMNAVPAAILLRWWRRFEFAGADGALWRWFAILSLVLMALLFVSPATTALDRIGLYLLPLQLVVFSQLPDVFGTARANNQGWVALVLGYYAVVQFVWLNYAAHAYAWVPYRFYLLEGLI